MSVVVLEDVGGNPLTGADGSAATAYMEGLIPTARNPER
jgi:hypothetical protein